MITQYATVSANCCANLEEKVNKLIQLVWQPQGGVSTVKDVVNIEYVQAIVKLDKD
jgi:hypothetical protein